MAEFKFEVALPAPPAIGQALLTDRALARRWLGVVDDPLVTTLVVADTVALEGRADHGVVTAIDPNALTITFDDGSSTSLATVTLTQKGSQTQVKVRETELSVEHLGMAEAAWRRAIAQFGVLALAIRREHAGRQAVVVVHGMGEQLPGSTIRGFAAAMLGNSIYLSKPDRFTNSYELRRLQAWQSETRPRTDFFEFYWQHRIRDTTFNQVSSWLRALLRRPTSYVPPQLRGLYRLIRVLFGAALAAAVILIVAIGFEGLRGIFDQASAWSKIGLIAFVIGIITSAVTGFVVKSLGDVARYVSPKPDNIEVRRMIREDGVALLRHLHGAGVYQRIVVVGHSLGSIVAYDALTNYWTEVNTIHDPAACVDGQPALAAYEALPPEANIDARREAQTALWREQRQLGNPWLVTDFITAGSPLVHAQLLLAEDADDLAHKQRQRELPTCPPQPDVETPSGQSASAPNTPRHSYGVQFATAEGLASRQLLHHGAAFAPTRWTNLYFPTKWLIFGDPVGGALGPVFGPGIHDIAVSTASRWQRRTLRAHSNYWRQFRQRATAQDALVEMREAVHLDCKDELGELLDELPLAQRVPGDVGIEARRYLD